MIEMRGGGVPVSGNKIQQTGNEPERKLTFLDDIHIKVNQYVEYIRTSNQRLDYILSRLRGPAVANNEAQPRQEPCSLNDKFTNVHQDMEDELKYLAQSLSELENWI